MESYNEKQENFRTDVRKEILSGLQKLDPRSTDLFLRMYGKHKGIDDIETCVNELEEEKLAWAYEQVQRTVNKLGPSE